MKQNEMERIIYDRQKDLTAMQVHEKLEKWIERFGFYAAEQMVKRGYRL